MLNFMFGRRYNFTDTLYIALTVGAIYQDAYWVAAGIFTGWLIMSVLGEVYNDRRSR